MNRQLLIVLVLLGIVPLALSLSATALPEKEVDPHTTPPPGATFSVDEGAWTSFTSDFKHEQDFENALKMLKERDLNEAAAEISRGEAFLKIEHGRATAEGRELLKQAAMSLNNLAKSIKSGADVTADDVALLFSRADYALAKHHDLLAQQQWSNQDEIGSGNELSQAVGDLLAAMRWADYNPASGITDSLAMAAETCQQMKLGDNYDPSQVSQAFAVVESALNQTYALLHPKEDR
jgi:hypothetical protein